MPVRKKVHAQTVEEYQRQVALLEEDVKTLEEAVAAAQASFMSAQDALAACEAELVAVRSEKFDEPLRLVFDQLEHRVATGETDAIRVQAKQSIHALQTYLSMEERAVSNP